MGQQTETQCASRKGLARASRGKQLILLALPREGKEISNFNCLTGSLGNFAAIDSKGVSRPLPKPFDRSSASERREDRSEGYVRAAPEFERLGSHAGRGSHSFGSMGFG